METPNTTPPVPPPLPRDLWPELLDAYFDPNHSLLCIAADLGPHITDLLACLDHPEIAALIRRISAHEHARAAALAPRRYQAALEALDTLLFPDQPTPAPTSTSSSPSPNPSSPTLADTRERETRRKAAESLLRHTAPFIPTPPDAYTQALSARRRKPADPPRTHPPSRPDDTARIDDTARTGDPSPSFPTDPIPVLPGVFVPDHPHPSTPDTAAAHAGSDATPPRPPTVGP